MALSHEQLGPNSQDDERRGTQQILQDIWLSILKRHPHVSMVYQVLYNSKPSSPYKNIQHRAPYCIYSNRYRVNGVTC